MTNNSNVGGTGARMSRDQKDSTPATTSTRNYFKEKLQNNSLLAPWLLAVEKHFSRQEAQTFLKVPEETFTRFYSQVVAQAVAQALQDELLLEQVAQVSRQAQSQIKSYIAFDFGDICTHADFGAFVPLSPEVAKGTGIGVWQAVLEPQISKKIAEATALPEKLVADCAKLQIDRLFLAMPAQQARSQTGGSIA
jgi:hypothetical protein